MTRQGAISLLSRDLAPMCGAYIGDIMMGLLIKEAGQVKGI
jgi:hypothetical protein